GLAAHIVAIILQVKGKMQALSERENRRLPFKALVRRRDGHSSGEGPLLSAYVPKRLRSAPTIHVGLAESAALGVRRERGEGRGGSAGQRGRAMRELARSDTQRGCGQQTPG